MGMVNRPKLRIDVHARLDRHASCLVFVHQLADSFHTSSPRSVNLTQLYFSLLAVVSAQDDFHLQDRAHAGRTHSPPNEIQGYHLKDFSGFALSFFLATDSGSCGNLDTLRMHTRLAQSKAIIDTIFADTSSSPALRPLSRMNYCGSRSGSEQGYMMVRGCFEGNILFTSAGYQTASVIIIVTSTPSNNGQRAAYLMVASYDHKSDIERQVAKITIRALRMAMKYTR
jgi:hypothetical protein